MSKKAKKRTKRYQGEDAKRTNTTVSAPVVHRYEAVERSKFGEWFQPRKRALTLLGKIVGGGAVGIILLFELFKLVF
jgi:hypothetical protein